MLHARFLTVVCLLLTLSGPLNAEQRLRCTTCGETLQRGYRLADAIYCATHLQQMLPSCSNCGQSIRGDYRAVGIPARPVCLGCEAAFASCFLCAAPVDPSNGGVRLSDGRPLCSDDARTAVVSGELAEQLFWQAAADVERALGSTLALKQPVKAVRLVDVPGLLEAARGQYQQSTLMSGRVLGLTTLTLKTKGTRRWTEPAVVHLLDGVPRERFLTVCAHEYAHVWHAENHPHYSATSSELREGFAEWVAYKVCEQQQRQQQMAVLTYPNDGEYYEGLRKFLALERDSGVSGVLRFALTATRL